MRKTLIGFVIGLVLGLMIATSWRSAFAQDMGIVVPSCGANPAPPYTVGGVRPMAVDVNGNACTVGGTGSGVSGINNAGFPIGATPITATATGTTGAVTASITPSAGRWAYVCGFNITATDVTTASTVSPTVGSLIGGTTFTYTQARLTTAPVTLSITYSQCLPASAVSTAIAVTSPADANGSSVIVNAWGFQQ